MLSTILCLAVVARAAATSSATGVTYSHHAGALMSGGDLGQPQNLTTSAAMAHCSALPSCAGFTFECAGGVSACDATSATQLKTYFKSSTAGNTDTAWWTYIKQRPKLFAQSFGSHMVLQHTRPCLWGFGLPGADVTLEINGTAAASATVATNGTWQACLPTQPASLHAPASIGALVGTDHQELTDCLFGEVWVASGQSNMAFSVAQSFNHTAECDAARNYPSLRLFTVAVNFDWQQTHTGQPVDFNQSGIRQQWSVSSADSACGGGDFDFFSAVAFFFCRDLQAHLDVPVGCVATSVPGTNIELWSSSVALAQCPQPEGSLPQPNWSALWNAMVAPLTRMTVAGFIWYQGEANVGDRNYGCRFKAMISDWRHRFSTDGHTNQTSPFLFAQLAGWHGDKPSFGGSPCMIEGGDASAAASGAPTFGGAVPQQRLTQLEALSLPNVGMACTVDLGDPGGPYWPGSIHPRHKQPVGARLALEARRIAYGEVQLLSRGPQLEWVEPLPTDAPGGSYHSKAVQILRVHWKSTELEGGEGSRTDESASQPSGSALMVAPGGFGAVVFVATLNNSLAVPCSIMPTNITAASCDVYCNIGYAWPSAEPHCVPKVNCTMPHVVSLAHLPFDYPVAAIFNTLGLPAEPFNFTLNV